MKEGEHQNSDKLYDALGTFMENIAEYFKNKNVEDSKEGDINRDVSYSQISDDNVSQQEILNKAYREMLSAYNGEWTRSLNFDKMPINDLLLIGALNDLWNLIINEDTKPYTENDFKAYADGLRKLKKFARKGNNKNIIARLYIKKIGELMNKRKINEAEDDFDNKLLRLKCIYTLLYRKYNEDSVIDALLSNNNFKLKQSSGRFSLPKGQNKYQIVCHCFDVYRIKKMADMIKKDDKFCERFFKYLCEGGHIKKDVFLYLIHDSVAKDEMEDYILKNNIGIFMSDQDVYALDGNNPKQLKNVAKILAQGNSHRLDVYVNGLRGHTSSVKHLVNSSNVLLLPYKWANLRTVNAKRDVIDKYSDIVNSIFNSYNDLDKKPKKRPKKRMECGLHGYSNGCFIVSGLAKRIAHDARRIIDEVEFEGVPIRFPFLSDSIDDIVDDMRNIRNKNNVKKITIVNTYNEGIKHPHRRGTALAKELSSCGYDNVLLRRHISETENINIPYHMTNDNNEDRVIRNSLKEWLKELNEGDYCYIRNKDDVIVCRLGRKGKGKSKPVISVFLCKSKEAKETRTTNDYNKLQEKYAKQTEEAFKSARNKYRGFFSDCIVLIGDNQFVADKIGGGHSYDYGIVPAPEELLKLIKKENQNKNNVINNITQNKSGDNNKNKEELEDSSENEITGNINNKDTFLQKGNQIKPNTIINSDNITNALSEEKLQILDIKQKKLLNSIINNNNTTNNIATGILNNKSGNINKSLLIKDENILKNSEKISINSEKGAVKEKIEEKIEKTSENENANNINNKDNISSLTGNYNNNININNYSKVTNDNAENVDEEEKKSANNIENNINKENILLSTIISNNKNKEISNSIIKNKINILSKGKDRINLTGTKSLEYTNNKKNTSSNNASIISKENENKNVNNVNDISSKK